MKTKFKVGDKVRRIMYSFTTDMVEGNTYTVSSVDNSSISVFEIPDRFWKLVNFELANPRPKIINRFYKGF